MPQGFTEAVAWIFQTMLVFANLMSSNALLQMFLALGILYLVIKIYDLLS